MMETESLYTPSRWCASLCAALLCLGALPGASAGQTTRPSAPEPVTSAATGEAEGTCFVIEVHGVIGEDFTAAQMRRGLERAEEASPDVVILDIDTPGGRVQDATKIVDMIIEHDGLRFAAYVRRGLSAGAAIALACEDICMHRAGTIGAATSYHVDARGRIVELPADVEEKFRSVWRAACRKAAANGGHSTLLAEAMADRDFALTMREGPDGPILERDGDGKVLAAKERLLTLTAGEAVACGLAVAQVKDREAVADALGFTVLAGLSGRADADAPDTLYGILRAKLDERPDATELTELQRSQRAKAMGRWLGRLRRKYVGRRVYWAVILEEVKSPPSAEEIRTAKAKVRAIQEKLWDLPRGEREATSRRLQEARERLRRLYYFTVVAHPKGDPDFRIVSRFPKRAAQQFTDAKRGDTVYVSGEVEHIEPTGPSRGDLDVQDLIPRKGEPAPVWPPRIRLTDCRTGPQVKAMIERRKQAREAAGDEEAHAPAATPAAAAGKRLKMAKLYLANDMADKAMSILREVMEKYPETEGAAEARKLLAEIESNPGDTDE